LKASEMTDIKGSTFYFLLKTRSKTTKQTKRSEQKLTKTFAVFWPPKAGQNLSGSPL